MAYMFEIYKAELMDRVEKNQTPSQVKFQSLSSFPFLSKSPSPSQDSSQYPSYDPSQYSVNLSNYIHEMVELLD